MWACGLLHALLMRSKHMLFLLMTVSNIVSECVTIIHAKTFLCQHDLCRSFQIPSKCTIYCPWFQPFSLHFQIVSNGVRMHFLASLLSKVCMQFEIVSNAARMHPLLSLFKKKRFCVGPVVKRYPDVYVYAHVAYTFYFEHWTKEVIAWYILDITLSMNHWICEALCSLYFDMHCAFIFYSH